MDVIFDYELARVALVLGLGLLGWLIAARVNMPAPAILGPMLVVAAATTLGVPSPDFPHWLRILVQSIIGGYIGLRIDRATLASTRPMVVPIVASTMWFIVATLLIGYGLARLTNIDLYTALLASTPGGVAEMTAIAMTVHADVAMVATMQVVRFFSNNLGVPFLVRRGASSSPIARNETDEPVSTSPLPRGLHWIVCLCVGALGGFVLDALQVPAGGVIGAMTVVAAVQLAGVRLQPLPMSARSVAQMLLGVFVGVTFTQQTLIELQNSFAMIVGATLATLASSFLLAFVIQRWMRLDVGTALLGCAPGGLTLMPMIADELGAQTFVVSLFQLVRVVIVILVMPIIFQILINF